VTDTIKERLKKILVDQLGYSLDSSKIRDDTSLYGKGLGLDSVDVVSLVVKLEEEFDVFFEADEVTASVETFGSMVEAIQQKLSGRER
jgi:acyl carrier protein